MKVICGGCRSSGRLLRGTVASAGPWKMNRVSQGVGAVFLPRETVRGKAGAVVSDGIRFCGAKMRPSPIVKGIGKQ